MEKGGCHYYHVKKEGEAIHIQNVREKHTHTNRIKSTVVHSLTTCLSLCVFFCLEAS